RRIAEHSDERLVETAPLTRRHSHPQVTKRIRSAALLEPFEIRRSNEVRHRHPEEATVRIHLRIRRQPAADRPLAQNRRANRACRPPRAGDSPLDHRRIALDQPSRCGQRDWIEWKKMREHTLRPIARWPQKMHEMRHLVSDEQIDPVVKFAELTLRLRRLA